MARVRSILEWCTQISQTNRAHHIGNLRSMDSKAAPVEVYIFIKMHSSCTLILETANQLYRHILASEYTPQMGTPSCMAITSHGQPPPSKRCNKPRVFTYYSENSSRSTLRATLTLDSTEHQAYSRIPLSVDTRKQLLRPMKKLRSISTVPFRVLDAPDLVVGF